MHANTYTQNNYSYKNYTNKDIYTNYVATQTHAQNRHYKHICRLYKNMHIHTHTQTYIHTVTRPWPPSEDKTSARAGNKNLARQPPASFLPFCHHTAAHFFVGVYM